MNQPTQRNWQIILRYGLIGGVVILYVTMTGMVEAFSLRNLVGTFLSMGHVLFFLGALGSGYLAARAFKHNAVAAFGGALAAGLISSILPILLIFFIQVFVVPLVGQKPAFQIRDMFVKLSPGLAEFITFGKGPYLGSLLMALLCAVMGGVGSAFVLLPRRWSLALVSGLAWTLGIGLFSENVGQILQGLNQRDLVKMLFQKKSLNPTPALVIFGITFLVGYYKVHEKFQNQWNSLPRSRRRQGSVVGLILGIALLLLLPWIVGLFLSQALFMIGLYVMMGLGLNIVVGYAGLLDLGYVAFFAFGAYIMGLMTTLGPLAISNFNFWMALPFCVLAGVLWGTLLGFPVLRMRGDYLAIVTLGFGEIIRLLALSDWLAPIEGGAQGILHIPTPELLGITLNTPQTMYYLVILGSLLAAFVTVRLRDSRLGRQWMAMREDEDVAEAMGINLVQSKLLAFAIGAAFSALAGGIFAARLGTIFPHSFNLLWSINALSLIIVGGLGSIPGVVIGALVLVGLPEILREFSEYRLLLYGILLIVMMLIKPEGFLPAEVFKRELRVEEEKTHVQPLETAVELESQV